MSSTLDVSSPWIKILEEIAEKKTKLQKPKPEFLFPWEEWETALKNLLDVETLSFSIKPATLKNGETLHKEIGKEPAIVALYIASIAEPIYWILSSDHQIALTSYFLSEKHPSDSFSDPRLQEGYYSFLILKITNCLSQISALKGLKIRLELFPVAPSFESAFCIDLSITLPSRTIGGKLIYTPAFFESFIQEIEPTPKSILQQEEAEKLSFPFNLHVGSVLLNEEEWAIAQAGDFIILDNCSFDPKTHKGSTELFLDGKPLLRARFKADGLKITDYSFHTKQLLEETKPLEPVEEDLNVDEIEEPLKAPIEEAPHIHTLLLNAEMGTIDLTIPALLEIVPGHVIETSLPLSSSAYLTQNKKIMARGEIIKIGTIIGFKLLEISNGQ